MYRRVLRKVWKNEEKHIPDALRNQNVLHNLGLTPDFYRTFGYPSQFSTVYLILLPNYFHSKHSNTNGTDPPGTKS